MSNKFDDENLDDLKEVDKKKRMLGRYDEKVVKKLGYDDVSNYVEVERVICDLKELEQQEISLKNEKLEDIKREEDKKLGGDYSLVSRKGGRSKQTIWWKNVPVDSWYLYVTSGKDNMIFNNDYSVVMRRKDILLGRDSSIWRFVGVNYKKKDRGKVSHFGWNKWKNIEDQSNVWVRKGTRVFSDSEFREYIDKNRDRRDDLDKVYLRLLSKWKKYEDKNFDWRYFGNRFLSKTEIFQGQGQLYEVTNMVEEGMRLIRNVEWNRYKKFWKSKEVEEKINSFRDDMLMLNGELTIDRLDKVVEREVQSRMSHYKMMFRSQERMKEVEEEKRKEKEKLEEKVKYHLKYIKGNLTENEIDYYLQSDDYVEMNKRYEDKVLRPERLKELSGLLTRLVKDGLDEGEIPILKGMRKSIKDSKYITRKQLLWLIGRLEYDVKFKELLMSGKLTKSKVIKRFECVIKKD